MIHVRPHTHTHPFNGPLSGTTRVSWYQKRKTDLDFTEARDSEWQWHPLGHTQVCTLLQTDNHASTSLLSVFTGRMPFLPPNQQRHSTESNYQTNYLKIYRTDICEVFRGGMAVDDQSKISFSTPQGTFYCWF